MTIQELFITSNEALLAVINKIADDQLKLELTGSVPGSGSNVLSEIVKRHTYDDAWVPDVLAGKTAEEVGDVYEPLLTAEDIKGDYAKYNQRAIDAVRGFSDLDRTTHLSYGDFPAGEYLQHIITFRVFRAYDIAKLIGADPTMDPAFAQALLDEYSPVIENYRKMGVFPPPIEVADDASPQAKLLAMVGRS